METRDTSPHTALTDDLNYNEQIIPHMEAFGSQIKDSPGQSSTVDDLSDDFEAETPTLEPNEDWQH